MDRTGKIIYLIMIIAFVLQSVSTYKNGTKISWIMYAIFALIITVIFIHNYFTDNRNKK